jgi:hypothetical protein
MFFFVFWCPTIVSLLTRTLDLATQFGPDLDPLAREAVSRHLVDLVALVLGAKGDTADFERSGTTFPALRAPVG